MFPDVYEEENSGNEPSAVGIVIADETPFNIEGIYPNCSSYIKTIDIKF